MMDNENTHYFPTKVWEINSSKVVTIPIELAEYLKIKPGDSVFVGIKVEKK